VSHLHEGFDEASSVHLQNVPHKGQRIRAWREAATILWVAPDQKKQEAREESKEEEDTELHGPSLTAVHLAEAWSWTF
jgi:hypothetical protein